MPTLEFKGRPFVYSHHLSVPFLELVVDAKRSLPAKGAKASLDDNLIIHGDNLEALKALLPRCAGKVDVIYIDPPYNTGNEGWAYNDNVNSPLMKEWLGKVVDRDDLERHDKWLCMMWSRLLLLKELLPETGVIFAGIDDNEIHDLRCIMDEVFGSSNPKFPGLVAERDRIRARSRPGRRPARGSGTGSNFIVRCARVGLVGRQPGERRMRTLRSRGNWRLARSGHTGGSETDSGGLDRALCRCHRWCLRSALKVRCTFSATRFPGRPRDKWMPTVLSVTHRRSDRRAH